MRIKMGEVDLIDQLWEQVAGFVKKKANSFLKSDYSYCGFDFDDLCQEGFLATLDAVKKYDVDTCHCHFKSYLATVIDRRYLAAVYSNPGSRSRGPKNIIDCALSLELPLCSDSGVEETIGESIKADEDQIDELIHQIWLAELRAALKQALASIDEKQAAAVWRYYADGTPQLTQEEKRLASCGLNKLRSRYATFQLLQRFIYDLE